MNKNLITVLDRPALEPMSPTTGTWGFPRKTTAARTCASIPTKNTAVKAPRFHTATAVHRHGTYRTTTAKIKTKFKM